MRMWMLNPELMCRHHLLGEHAEIHKHRHIFEKQYSIAGRRGQIEPLSMKRRHDRLAAEITRRGWKHKSPYTLPDLSYLPADDLNGRVDRVDSLCDLMDRCEQCRLLLATRQEIAVGGAHD